MLTWPAAPALSLSSNYLVQSRLRHQQELPNGSEIQGPSWAPLFVWSSQDRQHGEARPGQSPRKSLLPALGVTAGHSSRRCPLLGRVLQSTTPYHTIPHHTTPYHTIPPAASQRQQRRMRVKCPLPLALLSPPSVTHIGTLEPSDTCHPPNSTGSNLSTAPYQLAWR